MVSPGARRDAINHSGVADDHGDGHRFAESAGERQEHGAHDAGARPGDDDLPGGFPARGAEGHGGFALFARDGEENFARNGNNEGYDHDGENDSGGEKSDAVIRSAEEGADIRKVADRMDEQRTEGGAHQRHDDEDSEQAVNDTGDSSEQIDQK